MHGKGFSRSNIVYMRLLYLRYPISQKPSHQLSWSHFVELLKIEDGLERRFYENSLLFYIKSNSITLSKNYHQIVIQYLLHL